MELANLEYAYFFKEHLAFPPNYREFQLDNINSLDAKTNLIKRNLERGLKSLRDIEVPERKKFEYNNILGDLNLNIFLIIKKSYDFDFELLRGILKESINYYQKAEEFSKFKEETLINIEYLPVFTDLLKEIKVLHFLNVENKIIGLKNYFKEYFD